MNLQNIEDDVMSITKWNDSSKIYPKQTCDLQDEIFCISDGQTIGLAIWVNLCSEDPECGADQDEYDFKVFGDYIEPKFWIGPISKSNFFATYYQSQLRTTKPYRN